jgi:hypothetical protein
MCLKENLPRHRVGTSPQDMTKRDSSDCKYVQIFSHRAGSKSAPSRRTVFVGWTDAKHGEVSDVTMRNTEAILEGEQDLKPQ